MHQHTGNWAGKTVDAARGVCKINGERYEICDLPGCYTLCGGVGEERVSSDFLRENPSYVTVVVCDSTCLERSLILALQVIAIRPNTVICMNLMDEARKKGISVDICGLSEALGVSCVGVSASKGEGINELKRTIGLVCHNVKSAAERSESLEFSETGRTEATTEMSEEEQNAVICRAESLCSKYVSVSNVSSYEKRRRGDGADGFLLRRSIGVPVMLLALTVVLWITVIGANYPSELLRKVLFFLEDRMYETAVGLGVPYWIRGALISGAFHVLSWVVSVMLPPMAIFFPLFTLLEDVGYLPRAAFLLDTRLKRCGACGKQALTMCMGLGCNAVGVSGCRIISSARERRIAILTNVFMPCNGRFPTVIALAVALFAPLGAGAVYGSAVGVLLALLLGVFLTFAVSKLLSLAILKGEAEPFVLELPPFRMPNVGRVIVRSFLDRTVFVLGRAAAIAAPMGALIWICGNIHVGGESVLGLVSGFLDPFAVMLGLDGVIFLAFLLGFTANEIVLPVAVTIYSGASAVTEFTGQSLYEILSANGWTVETVLCAAVFCICHFPCAATLSTVKKETGSVGCTAFAALLPTAIGMLLCFLIHMVMTAVGV